MKPGSLVICINDSGLSPDANAIFNSLPIKNKIYQVRRVIPDIFDPPQANPAGIALEEIFGDWEFLKTRDGTYVYEEIHFRMDRFVEILAPINIEEIEEIEQQDCVIESMCLS